MNATQLCSAPSCESKARGLGLCNLHYKRMRRASGAAPTAIKTCSVSECEKAVRARGMCGPHDLRARRYGDPTAAGNLRRQGRPECKIEMCERDSHGRGYCKMHYKRLVNNGDPNIAQKNVAEFPVVNGMKTCLGCGEHKPLAGFYVSGSKVQPRCKDCALEQARASYEKDRLKFIARSWNSRYREVGEVVTLDQLKQRFTAYGWACWMCGGTNDLCVDHVKPRSKGGPHIPANIRPACASCNGRKHDHWFGAMRANEFKV